MTRTFCFGAALALALPLARAAEPTTDEIIAKYTEAIGGADRIRSVTTLRTVSRLTVSGLSDNALVVSTMKVPQMVYTEITRGGTKFIEAFDGQTKWAMMDGGKAKKAPEDEALAYAADTSVMVDGPLVNYKEKGHQVRYAGREDVQGKSAFKMELTLKSGNTETLFLDADSYLPIKQIGHAKRNGRETETSGYFLDYKNIDGFTVATTLLIKAGDGPPIALKIEKLEFNFPLNEALFRMPN